MIVKWHNDKLIAQVTPHSDLHSYLLGDHEDEDNQPNNNPPGRHNNNRIPGLGEGLHAAHQAILQQGGPVGFQPYHRPINFPLKVTVTVMVLHIMLSLLKHVPLLTFPVQLIIFILSCVFACLDYPVGCLHVCDAVTG